MVLKTVESWRRIFSEITRNNNNNNDSNIIKSCLCTLNQCLHVNQFIYLLSMCQMCQRCDIESCLATISSSSSPLTPTSLFCDPFIISHLTVWQNGSVAVKHLQGHSTGHASTFCLAISWSVQGMRERGRESIWSHHCQETARRGVRRGGRLEGVGGCSGAHQQQYRWHHKDLLQGL